MRASAAHMELELGLAARAAWLSYVGGHRQEDIAQRLGVSRIKINRLIALAHRRGLVRVFVEGSAAECVALEDRITRHYGLSLCVVAPSLDEDSLPLRALAAAGAQALMAALERTRREIVGIGHGRTLAAVVEALPRLPHARVRFVSLLGSLTRNAAANPFDVIHRLAERTGGESYFMPAPFFADSVADKDVLLAQKSLRDVFALARRAGLHVVGIGEVSDHAHLLASGMINRAELEEVQRAGAVGEVLGHFLDASGRPVDAGVNQRAVALALDDLAGKEVLAIAGGHHKARAIDSVLKSRVITGLVTDESTARRMVERLQAGAENRAGPTP